MSEQNLTYNERLKELDVLRAIAFIFVVEQHTMGGYSNIKGISYTYYQIFKFFYTIATPAVAVFFCISAISLFHVYSKKFDCKKFYVKRIKKTLIPYIVWSLLYMYMAKNIINFSHSIIQILAGNACYHLWYMAMLLRVLIYFPIILYISKKIHIQDLRLRLGIFVMFLLSYYEISKYQNIISNKVTHFIFNNPVPIQARIINVSPLFWSLYFILGIYISLNYKNFKTFVLKFKFPIVIGYIILLIHSYLNQINIIKFNRSLSLMYYIFTILCWYIISIYLSYSINVYNLFNFISKYSFAGYLVHILVAANVVNFVRLYFHLNNWLIIGLLTWILTIFISLIIIKLISYIPYSEFVTGVYSSKHKKQIQTNINNINISKVNLNK